MGEKLLTIKEASEYLGISEEEVKCLVDNDEIPAYKVGNTFLRFRKEQLDAVRSEVAEAEKVIPICAATAADPSQKLAHPYTDLEREIKQRQPSVQQYDYTVVERVRDFFYFNDFYILSAVTVFLLLYIIMVQS